MIFSNFFFKKNIFTYVLTLSLVLFSSNVKSQDYQQFYNYGFEEWINEGQETVEPAHWHSFKSASGSFNFLMSQQIAPSSETRPGSDGSRSARIYSKSIVGITANGNMTTGRINAGSMSPAGSENYNYTQRNSDYCTPMTVLPDSLTVWVCFRAGSADSEASVITAIHGDADFQMLGDGGYSPANMLCATANMQYTRTSSLDSGEYVWKRLSIPFTAYPEICSDYRYILTTFTTNKNAGAGNANDEVLIDDIYLIYNPSLALGELKFDELCYPADGSELKIDVPFVLKGTMSADNLNSEPNMVIAQLSDENGSFDNAIELGRGITNESGTIQAIVPYGIANGDGYRIRVVSTNYPMTSADNGNDITISGNTDVPSYYATKIEMYPNPTNGDVTIDNINVEFVEIYSMQGQCVGRYHDKHINIENLSSGMYFLKVKDYDGRLFTDKIIKR